MSGEFDVDPGGLSRVIQSLHTTEQQMGEGVDAAPRVPDAGESSDASADALSTLMETVGGAVEAVSQCAQRLTEVRDTYVRGDEASSQQLSRLDPR